MISLTKLWESKNWMAKMLLPFSFIFWILLTLRKVLLATYTQHFISDLPCAVIVVGNITVGGTGKTPFIIFLAKQLASRGIPAGVITRGYGRSLEGTQEVNVDSDPWEVGDEACLLKDNLESHPVFVGKHKYAVAASLIKCYPNTKVILSDDGLQHYRLKRDVEVCMVDGSRLFGNGFLLPSGPMREPLSRLRDADFVIIKNGNPTQLEHEACFAMSLEGKVISNLQNKNLTMNVETLINKKFHALAGIGNPSHFFDLLTLNNVQFYSHVFPDHHKFTPADFNFEPELPILMTEKDAVKCKKFARHNWWMLPVNVRINDDLINPIIRKIRRISG